MNSTITKSAAPAAVSKKLRSYILQNILAMLGTSCYILADTFFISAAEGSDGITALNLVLPLYSLIFAIGSMISTGSATRYAIAKASGSKTCDVYFSNAIFFAVAASIIFILGGVFCPETIIRIMGADDQIAAVGTSYTRIFLVFAPCFMLNYAFTSFVRNDSDPTLAMAATLTSSFSNIFLDYLFMFPLRMGMSGAALATGLSPVISISICAAHFFTKKNTLRFIPTRPSVRRLFRSCQLGISAFIGEMSSGITTTVFNFLLLELGGNTAVAAYGVVANFALVGTAVFNGIGQGIQPLASEVYGKSNQEEKQLIIRRGTLYTAAAALLVTGAVLFFANSCVALFNSENSVEMAAYAVPGIRLYFLGFLFAGFNIVGTGYLSATAHAKPAFAIAILRGVAAITAFAFLLSRLLGIDGIWLAFPAAELCCLVLTVMFLRRDYRIN